MTAPQPLSPDAIAAARIAAYDDALDALYEYHKAMADAARDEIHEAHGGDEHPDHDDCDVCIVSLEERMLWGVSS